MADTAEIYKVGLEEIEYLRGELDEAARLIQFYREYSRRLGMKLFAYEPSMPTTEEITFGGRAIEFLVRRNNARGICGRLQELSEVHATGEDGTGAGEEGRGATEAS